jgi:2-oxoglutarate ferredoxin oxidoreductase subunit beta
VLTGLLYVNPEQLEVHDILNTIDQPLNELTEAELMPGTDALEAINASFR